MNYRYFRFTEGPVCEAANQLDDLGRAWREEVQNLTHEMGCERVYLYDDKVRLAGFSKPREGEKDWKKTRFGHYWPKKNTKGGKELLAKIATLPKCVPIGNCVRSYGIFTDFPCIIEGHTAALPQVFGGKGLWFLMVPWAEYDPQTLAEYKSEREAGNRFSAEFDHALWEAPADWQEVKRWQVEKEIDEVNAAKQEAA